MTDPARISELMLENLFAVFNVRDPERRREAIARNYTEDVTWTDPDGTTEGRESLNERAQKLLDRLPDFVFTAAGPST
jgi:SnoaL-like domain